MTRSDHLLSLMESNEVKLYTYKNRRGYDKYIAIFGDDWYFDSGEGFVKVTRNLPKKSLLKPVGSVLYPGVEAHFHRLKSTLDDPEMKRRLDTSYYGPGMRDDPY